MDLLDYRLNLPSFGTGLICFQTYGVSLKKVEFNMNYLLCAERHFCDET